MPHILGDPYEEWASQFTPGIILTAEQLTGFRPKKFDNFEKYFDDLAQYSNSNFYSKDTIGIQSGYQKPVWNYLNYEENNKYFYLLANDEWGQYYLASKAKNIYSVITDGRNLSISDPLIFQDYWFRLSRKVVLNGAGILDLFFKEVERLRNDNQFLANSKKIFQSKDDSKILSIFGSLSNTFKEEKKDRDENNQNYNEIVNEDVSDNFNNNSNDFSENIGNIENENINSDFISEENNIEENYHSTPYPSLLPETKRNPKITPTPLYSPTPYPTLKPNFSPSPYPSISHSPSPSLNPTLTPYPSLIPSPTPYLTPNPSVNPSPSPSISPTTNPTPNYSGGSSSTSVPSPTPIVYCNQSNSNLSSQKNIIINEIAWMGTLNSYNDEWIELKNVSNQAIDIKGWQLFDKKENIKIYFGEGNEGTIISPNGFYLLERTNDDSVPDISADLIYSGSINDTDETIKLFNSNCQLVDQVITNGGDNSNQWIAGEKEGRKTMERDSDMLNWHTYQGNGENGIFGTPKKENSIPTNSNHQNNNSNQTDNNPSPSPSPSPSPNNNSSNGGNNSKILISEFLFHLIGLDEEKEFIELYNSGDSEIDLNDWSLKKIIENENETNDFPLAKFGSKIEDTTIISPRGFLLIGLNGYNSDYFNGIEANILRSSSLGQTSGNKYIIQLIDNNDNIIDEISYTNESAEEGKSLERKSSIYSTSQSLAIGGNEELLGNGYDTGNMTDFLIRDIPQPQNTYNLPEPREKPPEISAIEGYIREGDGMPVISFSLSKPTSTKTFFLFRYSNSENEAKEENWDNLIETEQAEIILLENGKFEIPLKDLSPNDYYLLAKSRDIGGLESEASSVYHFELEGCTPKLSNPDNPFVKNISFYSCLGKYWLDFSFIKYPDPLPIGFRTMGFYFFKNKLEQDVCHDNETCFQNFMEPRPDTLAIKGLGGKSTAGLTNDSSPSFILSHTTPNSEIDYFSDQPDDFHFEISGYYDENKNILPANFSESDYISPSSLYWVSGPWWRRIKESIAQDVVFFEPIPQYDLLPNIENFFVDFNEQNKTFDFQFEINEEIKGEVKYEIRYLENEPINELNWGSAKKIDSDFATQQGVYQFSKSAFGFETDKKYYFGILTKTSKHHSSIRRAETFVPYPILDCSQFINSQIVCDSFNDYQTGSNLIDQNGWYGNGDWIIEDNIGKRDSKALVAKPKYSSVMRLSKDFISNSQKGGISFWVKRELDRSLPLIELGSHLTIRAWMEPFDYYIHLSNGAENVIYTQTKFYHNRWQKWIFAWDSETEKYKFKVDGYDWLELNWIDNERIVDKITFGANAKNVIFDDLKPYLLGN